jgi:hypothetical protein
LAWEVANGSIYLGRGTVSPPRNYLVALMSLGPVLSTWPSRPCQSSSLGPFIHSLIPPPRPPSDSPRSRVCIINGRRDSLLGSYFTRSISLRNTLSLFVPFNLCTCPEVHLRTTRVESALDFLRYVASAIVVINSTTFLINSTVILTGGSRRRVPLGKLWKAWTARAKWPL